jgi:hypothetical protein
MIKSFVRRRSNRQQHRERAYYSGVMPMNIVPSAIRIAQ